MDCGHLPLEKVDERSWEQDCLEILKPLTNSCSRAAKIAWQMLLSEYYHTVTEKYVKMVLHDKKIKPDISSTKHHGNCH